MKRAAQESTARWLSFQTGVRRVLSKHVCLKAKKTASIHGKYLYYLEKKIKFKKGLLNNT